MVRRGDTRKGPAREGVGRSGQDKGSRVVAARGRWDCETVCTSRSPTEVGRQVARRGAAYSVQKCDAGRGRAGQGRTG